MKTTTVIKRCVPSLTLLLVLTLTLNVSAARPNRGDITYATTPNGVEYGTWGEATGKPAPVLVVLASNIKDGLTKSNFLKAGIQLMPKGYLCVAIDLPCHGALMTAEERGLAGWGVRAARGDDFVAEFNQRLSSVLDHLIAEGLADPAKIAVTGTSRGGFLALRYAAFDPRVACVAGYAPVTDLRQLREFEIASDVALVDQMSMASHVEPLVGRPVFILIGDRDERVGTDAAISFARKLSAAAVKADVPSQVELRIVSEPRGHSTPAETGLEAARWIHRIIAGESL